MTNVKQANVRNRYNQIPHLTRDAICESDKESQEVSLFLGYKEQTGLYNKDKRETQIRKMIHHKRTPPWNGQKKLEGLNMFKSASLTLNSHYPFLRLSTFPHVLKHFSYIFVF